MLGLSPLLRPIPIHHTDDRPPLLADGPLAKGEGTSIRIQGNASCAAYTGSEVRMLVPDLHADGAALLEQRCWLKHVKATKLWSRACQQPPLVSLSLLTIQQRLGVWWLNGVQHGVCSWDGVYWVIRARGAFSPQLHGTKRLIINLRTQYLQPGACSTASNKHACTSEAVLCYTLRRRCSPTKGSPPALSCWYTAVIIY
jgi:hypothetical protein